MRLSFGIITVLLSAHLTLAIPAGKKPTTTKNPSTNSVTTAAAAAATTMHDCSVFIQRWGHNAFDLYYYDVYWSPTSTRRQLYGRETTTYENGQYLPPWQMGSQEIKILNVENPVTDADTGKISVFWGSYKGNSWDGVSGCQTNVYRNLERATYLCYFRCDVPAAQ